VRAQDSLPDHVKAPDLLLIRSSKLKHIQSLLVNEKSRFSVLAYQEVTALIHFSSSFDDVFMSKDVVEK